MKREKRREKKIDANEKKNKKVRDECTENLVEGYLLYKDD